MTEQPPHNRDGEEEYVPADDRVIGRMFRHSLVAVAVLAAVAAVLYLVNRPQMEPAPPVNEVTVTGPEYGTAPAAPTAAPPVPFRDVTLEAGIDFVHVNGATGDKLLPETMGAGVAVFDYDNDGDQDLLFVNSNHWPGQASGGAAPTTMLYRNDGSGRFENVTQGSGLGITSYGTGVATGDYDNDGWVDVFITALGSNRLFHNRQGRFTEVTATAGVAGDDKAWSTGSAFFDYDNDGDLDLYVANYVRWSRDIDFEVDFRLTGIGRAYGPPTAFAGAHGYLYRNDGNGRFTDVSAASGIQVNNPATGAPMAKALAVAPVDVDGDGYLDLLIANDTVQNFFFHNRGDGTFTERGAELGVAFDRNGSATGAMGVDTAQYRNDNELAIAIGNFANEMTSLYVSQGERGLFADEAIGEGIGPATRLALSFGLFFFDYDLDGRLDLFQTNGHLEQEINVVQASQHYEQPAQLFWNCGNGCAGTFLEVDNKSAGDLARPIVGRGAAYGDLDGDGDLDIVITQAGRRPLLLRNESSAGHHWLRVKLVGKKVNRDAIGARLELVSGDTVQRRVVMPTRSYLSQCELPVTFGLGNNDRVDALRITWPDGSRQEVKVAAVDTTVVVNQ